MLDYKIEMLLVPSYCINIWNYINRVWGIGYDMRKDKVRDHKFLVRDM